MRWDLVIRAGLRLVLAGIGVELGVSATPDWALHEHKIIVNSPIITVITNDAASNFWFTREGYRVRGKENRRAS